jgi:hypothetical protein
MKSKITSSVRLSGLDHKLLKINNLKMVSKKHLFFILTLLFVAPAFSQTESIKIAWAEEYKFKVGSDQDTGQVHFIEMIPAKETLEKWTIMGNMMSIKGGQEIPVDAAMNMMFEQAQKNSDNAKLTLVEKSDNPEKPWILFKIETASFHNDKNPESQLYYITTGKMALYSNFIALKKSQLKDDFIAKWSKIFKASEIVTQ